MSLINEALKKAQRIRGDTPGTAPAAGRLIRSAEGPASRPGRSKTPLLAGGAILLVTVVGVAAYLLTGAPTPPKAETQKTSPPPPVVAAIPAPVPPSPPAPVLPAPAPVVALPPISTHVTTPATAEPIPNKTAPAIPTPMVSLPSTDPTPAAPPPPAPNKPSPQVYALLDAMHVTGIRTSDTDPKVLMNDRVYKLNDLVDRPTGLRITRIASDHLTFTDGAGFEYTKTF